MAKSRAESKSQKSRNPIIRYFQETQTELRKVTWPTREETLRLTLIVFAFTVAATIFLGLILDSLFRFLSRLLLF